MQDSYYRWGTAYYNEIVNLIRSIRAIGTIVMTTNGSLLGGMAHQLKLAGLDRVNISVDTINPE